ncbi:hypothetical protein EVAR_65191_1 [Eumeta japonica]|uniref:Uncharacterized protein n=1 Tax=Eumeta variegata TaxID=151549 RepID=A0A4C1ZIB9_EUMVA|nr:hypothetical protein EVAR_65191_1 [Eumeta japonica]
MQRKLMTDTKDKIQFSDISIFASSKLRNSEKFWGRARTNDQGCTVAVAQRDRVVCRLSHRAGFKASRELPPAVEYIAFIAKYMDKHRCERAAAAPGVSGAGAAAGRHAAAALGADLCRRPAPARAPPPPPPRAHTHPPFALLRSLFGIGGRSGNQFSPCERDGEGGEKTHHGPSMRPGTRCGMSEDWTCIRHYWPGTHSTKRGRTIHGGIDGVSLALWGISRRSPRHRKSLEHQHGLDPFCYPDL